MSNHIPNLGKPKSKRAKKEQEAVARRAALDQRLEMRVKQIGQERMAAFRKQRIKHEAKGS